MEKAPQGLKDTTVALMISTAVFFDALQWALAFIFMDWMVSIFALLTFYVWFKIHGMKFMTPKRVGTLGTASIIELVPFLAALPAWTLAITILTLDMKMKKVMSSHEEDSVEKKKAA